VLIAPARHLTFGGRKSAFTLPPWRCPSGRGHSSGVEVRLFDEAVEDVDLKLEAGLVGLFGHDCHAPRAYHLATISVPGGSGCDGRVHPSSLPDEALQHSDSVVIGEGEGQWGQVLKDADRGCLEKSTENSILSRWNNSLSGWDFFRQEGILFQTVQVTRGMPHVLLFLFGELVLRPFLPPPAPLPRL